MKYTVYRCKECEEQFLTRHEPEVSVCPYCEGRFIESIKDMWMKSPFHYRRRYTQEEDDVIIESVRRGYSLDDIELEGRSKDAIRLRYERLAKKGLTKFKRSL